jgi:hypothetical protein
MISWRLKQLQMLNKEFIEQDRILIDFVKEHHISTLILQGTTDIEYFQSYLPDTLVTPTINVYDNAVMAVLVNYPVCFELFLNKLVKQIYNAKPKYVYVAINKYLIKTNLSWPNLTSDYDKDLLDIVSTEIASVGYNELTRKYVANDRGQYFNFAHPTTNVYYEIL